MGAFDDAAAAVGLDVDRRTFPDGTRTAADAATAVGCDVAQIVKSLVFVAVDDDSDEEWPVLVLTSGANQVHPATVAALAGATRLRKADADEVRRSTGYAIGGTAPIGHPAPLPTWIDVDLMQHDEVWAAAGTPRDVFALSPQELVRVTGGTVTKVDHPDA